MQATFTAATDIGRIREANEDSYSVLEKSNSAYICDGMGGHVAGATASQLAIDTIIRVNSLLIVEEGLPNNPIHQQLAEQLEQLNTNLTSPYTNAARNMINAIQLANHRIFTTALANPQFQGMGTTVVGMCFQSHTCHIVHVGDSRAYLIRNKQIEQLTVDHSWLNELLHAGKIRIDEVDKFPHRNVITRALGVNEGVQVDYQSLLIQEGDQYLLSSDGLHDLLPESEILNIVEASPGDPEKCVENLIREANLNGGKDNISVILARVHEIEPHPAEQQFQDTIKEETAEMKRLEDEILALLLEFETEETKTIPISAADRKLFE